MDRDELVIDVRYTVGDVAEVLAGYLGRKPTKDELERAVDEVRGSSIHDVLIDECWNEIASHV